MVHGEFCAGEFVVVVNGPEPTERALHSVDFAGIGFSRNAHGQYQTYNYNAFLKPYKQTLLLSFPEKCTG